MPLTLDLVTDGMRHCPGLTRGRWDHEKIEEMLSDPIARPTYFQELETNIRNSTVVGRAATDATLDDAWENLVRIIQETAGPYFYQGAPRSTRPLALERRRLLKDLATARRLTGVSADQTLVENAKIEVSREEKQMRRLSRWHPKAGRFLSVQIRSISCGHGHRYETPPIRTGSSLHSFTDRMCTGFGERRGTGIARILVERLSTRTLGITGPW